MERVVEHASAFQLQPKRTQARTSYSNHSKHACMASRKISGKTKKKEDVGSTTKSAPIFFLNHKNLISVQNKKYDVHWERP